MLQIAGISSAKSEIYMKVCYISCPVGKIFSCDQRSRIVAFFVPPELSAISLKATLPH